MTKHLRSVVFGLLLALASPLAAFAQCSGQAPASTYCGNPTGALALPGWKSLSGIPFPSIAGGTVVGNRTTSSATASAITNPILGIPGTSTGQIGLAGATSGTVTILPQAAAGTYNFNLPTGAGTAGQPLLSGGGGSSPMTFGTLSAAGGGTGFSSYTLGDVLYANTTTTLAKLAGNITTAKQYLSQTGTGAVSAAPAWATIDGSDITGAALTKVDDTNVTLTLGGTPTTALLRAASLTLGWTGQLGLTRGGTAASLTASNGGIVYSTAAALAILSGTATANRIVMSGSSAAPSWSTATYPATTTVSQLLYSSSANVITGLATANRGILNTDGSGVPSITPTPTIGVNGGTGGAITLNGSTSGFVTIRVASAAGTGTIFELPATNGSASQALQTNGSGVTSWSSFVKTVTKQTFTASGTYTPSTGMLFAQVEMVGGGAGGGGCAGTVGSIYSGGGGSSGGYSRSILTAATVGASKTVTVGSGGNGGTAGANTGSVGTASCLTTTSCVSGQIVVANGGAGGVGGSSASAPVGGAPAAAATGDIAAAGTAGLFGSNAAGTLANYNPSGGGGSSYFGGGAQGVSNAGTLTGANAGAYGSGGSGGNCYNTAGTAAGGNGSAGVVFITEYLSQ